MSLNEACKVTSLSRTGINKARAAGRFPEAVPLDGRRIAFVADEVYAFVRDRIAERSRKAVRQ
jgi:predicted DNA-binding transcriptional regulator AlpA